MSMAAASLYKRQGKLIICANAQVTEGYLIDHEPFVLLEEPVSASEVGRSIGEALAQYKVGVTPPQSSSEFFAFFTMLAGVDTYHDFMKDASYCSIERNNDVISFTAMRNDDGGFDEPAADAIELKTTANHEAIGRAALTALGRSG